MTSEEFSGLQFNPSNSSVYPSIFPFSSLSLNSSNQFQISDHLLEEEGEGENSAIILAKYSNFLAQNTQVYLPEVLGAFFEAVSFFEAKNLKNEELLQGYLTFMVDYSVFLLSQNET